MIIDSHAHTTDNKLWNLHTETATIEYLEKQARLFHIQKIVLMATYFPFKKGGVSNRELLKRIRGHDIFMIFGSLDAMNDFQSGLNELAQLAAEKLIAGIKLYPGYQDFNPSNQEIFPVYELAQKYNLPVALHSGELHGCCPGDDRIARALPCYGECRINQLGNLAHPETMSGAVEKFPGVKFILSHMGNPYFEELRKVMKRYPNVFTDISGQFISGGEKDTLECKKKLTEEIKKFLNLSNGQKRILFGSDFPIQSYADSIELVKHLGLSKKDEADIFFRNSFSLLNLKSNQNMTW